MDMDEAWTNVVRALMTGSGNFHKKIIEFKACDSEWLAYLKEKLSSKDRGVAISVLGTLTNEELQTLFDKLVYLGSFNHGGLDFIHELILRLPKAWVLENIRRYTEPILEKGDEDEYRRLLELFYLLDPDMTRELAKRAQQHSDPGIREAGDDFIDG